MRRHVLPALLVAVAACGDLPRIDPSVEGVPGSVLLGTVMVEDQPETAPTFLLLSTADDPMPPVGTGTPISFGAVRADAFGPPGARVQGASFAFTDVLPDAYHVVAVMDLDGNFHPEVSALATPTCGDVTGWHLDAFPDGVPAPVTVPEQSKVESVIVGPLTPLDAPQPTAVVVGTTALERGEVIRLEAVSVDATFGEIALQVPSDGPGCRAGFRFWAVDADDDGEADPSPLLPVPIPLLDDHWPRVILQWLGEPYDADGDGTLDAFDRGGVPEDVTIAAIGDPSPADVPMPAPNTALDVQALDVTFMGFGQRIEPDGTSTILGLGGEQLPEGAWSLTILTREGQIWTVPNELDDRLQMSRTLPPPGLTSGADARMGTWLTLD